MYRKVQMLGIPRSASAVLSNLTVLNPVHDSKAKQIAVVHKGKVAVVNWELDDLRPKVLEWKGGETTITQVSWVTFDDFTLLFVMSLAGLQVYDSDGSSLLFSYMFPSNIESRGDYCRGIAKLAAQLVCIGSRTGEVLTFSISKEGMDIAFEERTKVHGRCITDLASKEDRLVAADRTGALGLWKRGAEGLTRVWLINSYENACTSLAIWRSLLLASFGCGHIRGFQLDTGQFLVEACAHAAWITGLDVAQDTGLLLSTSEDSLVKIWKLNEGHPQITHKFCDYIQDTLVIGGRFLDSRGAYFCASGYDSKEVTVFQCDDSL